MSVEQLEAVDVCRPIDNGHHVPKILQKRHYCSIIRVMPKTQIEYLASLYWYKVKKKIGKGLNVLTKYVINQLKELCNISSLSALKEREKKKITFAIPIASITDKTQTKVYAWHPRKNNSRYF